MTCSPQFAPEAWPTNVAIHLTSLDLRLRYLFKSLFSYNQSLRVRRIFLSVFHQITFGPV